MNTSLLLEPQINHSYKLLESLKTNNVCCDMSMFGCGKSYVASAIIKELQRPATIICPKSAISIWEKVLRLFEINSYSIVNYEKLIRGSTDWLKYKDNLIILDEVHKCRGSKSKNSKLLVSLKNLKYDLYLISGSIAMNPIEMKSIGYALSLHNGSDYMNFCKENGAIPDGFGGLKIGNIQSQESMKKLHDVLFNDLKIASRITSYDFKGIFPDNTIITSPIDMDDNCLKIQSAYDEMEYELSKLSDDIKNYSQHTFAVMTIARRKIEMLKVPTMFSLIEELFDNGISPVLFVSFTDTVEAILKRLSDDKKFDNMVVTIVGGQSQTQRQKNIEDFQSDKKRVVIANLRCGSQSISLHDLNGNYPRNSIISPSFSGIDLTQALGRIFRSGGKTSVRQTILFSKGTIEETIANRVGEKIQSLSMLNDSDLLPPFIFK